MYLTLNYRYSHSDIRLRGPRLPNTKGQKLPVVQSQLQWIVRSYGLFPPVTKTYDDWIICEPYFNQPRYSSKRNLLCQGQTTLISYRVYIFNLFYESIFYRQVLLIRHNGLLVAIIKLYTSTMKCMCWEGEQESF